MIINIMEIPRFGKRWKKEKEEKRLKAKQTNKQKYSHKNLQRETAIQLYFRTVDPENFVEEVIESFQVLFLFSSLFFSSLLFSSLLFSSLLFSFFSFLFFSFLFFSFLSFH